MRAEEMAEKLEARLRTMETFRAWMTGAATVAGLIFAGGGVYVYALGRDVAVHETRLTTAEKNHAELQSKFDELYKAHDRLRRNVTVLWDRQQKGPPQIEAVVITGQIDRISSKEISVLPDDIDEPVYQFSLPDNLPISIDGRPATIAQLKVGMRASVVITKGKIERIQAATGGG
jgi:hypothetical protein